MLLIFHTLPSRLLMTNLPAGIMHRVLRCICTCLTRSVFSLSQLTSNPVVQAFSETRPDLSPSSGLPDCHGASKFGLQQCACDVITSSACREVKSLTICTHAGISAAINRLAAITPTGMHSIPATTMVLQRQKGTKRPCLD